MAIPPQEDGTLVNYGTTISDYCCPSCGAEFERTNWEKQIRLAIAKEKNAGRVLVRVISYRRRLIDRDNLFAKYFIDACRYSGVIREDSAKEVEMDIDQEQVQTQEEERTEITIEYPDLKSLARHNPRPLFG